MFGPVRPKRLADEVAAKLRGLILEGALRPGDRLPAERMLAERFDTSRPTVREALRLLEDEGLAEVRRGGLHVRDAARAAVSEPLAALFRADPGTFDDYLEFRGAIEGMAADLAALRATAPDREVLDAAFSEILAAHEAGDAGREADADTAFHVAVYEASHNLAVLHVMRGMAELLRSDVFFNRSALNPRVGYREATVAQHRAIHEAIQRGDPPAARAAAEAHVLFVRRALDEMKRAETRLDVSRRRAGGEAAVG